MVQMDNLQISNQDEQIHTARIVQTPGLPGHFSPPSPLPNLHPPRNTITNNRITNMVPNIRHNTFALSIRYWRSGWLSRFSISWISPGAPYERKEMGESGVDAKVSGCAGGIGVGGRRTLGKTLRLGVRGEGGAAKETEVIEQAARKHCVA
nr:hypothetical protein L203_01296 [Cryptococcus depauperatus CBS 7841]